MPNIIEEMTAFIELQMYEALFLPILNFTCSAAPNPFPTFPFLQGRLIQSVTFANTGERLLSSSEFAVPGQVAMSLPATINSIFLDDFIAGQSAGTSENVNYIVALSIVGLSLVASVVRVEHGPDQSQPYILPAPVPLAQQSFQQYLKELGSLGAGNAVKGGAVLFEQNDAVVVVRLAVTDLAVNFLATIPVKTRVFSASTPTKVWAVFLSGGAIAALTAENISQQLAAALPSDPSDPHYQGVVVSGPLEVDWAVRDQTWGLDVSVELDALGKCPTVIRAADIHVTLKLRIDFIAQIPNQAFLLWAHVRHSTSKWDTFICTAVNILAGGFIPLAGIGIGFASATLLPGIIYSTVSETVSSQSFTGFVKVEPPHGDDDMTLTQLLPMPTLYLNNVIPPGDAIEAVVDEDGVTVRGSWNPLAYPAAGAHAMQLTGTPIVAEWPAPSFNCQTKQMEIGPLQIPTAVIRDVFTYIGPGAGGQAIPVQQPTPVRLFQVLALDLGKWTATGTLDQNASFQPFSATPVGDPAALTGLTGRVFAHSSVGLAAAEIAPLPAKPVPEQPTGIALGKAIDDCQNFKAGGTHWRGDFDLHWLVDPAPWELAAGVMHEWAIRIEAIAADTTADLTLTSAAGRTTRASLAGAPLTLHMVTAAADQLHVTVRGHGAVTGSVGQRVLTVTDRYRLGAPIHAITRAEAGFTVRTASQVVTLSVERGIVAIQNGAVGALAPSLAAPVRAPALGSHFVRLDGQRVLVADGTDLVVAQAGRFKIGAQIR